MPDHELDLIHARNATLNEENTILRNRVSELERRETREYDCRMVGRVAEISGRHCPWDNPCQRCQLEDAEVERDKLAHTNLIITLEWKQELNHYRQVLKGFAEGDCSYGDGCPDTATRHGQCISCKAREALIKTIKG
jgi:hypothetical protein